MRKFKLEKPLEFENYALTDAIVSLYHCIVVENSSTLETGRLGIPITISSMAGKMIEKRLVNSEYSLPTSSGKFSEGKIKELYTPKGINLSDGLSDYLYLFVASYRGGRNESYKYGIVNECLYDYDLTGAYPTALSLLDYPDPERIKKVYNTNFSSIKGQYNLLKSFSAFKVEFTFNSTVGYPNLPVNIDETAVAFPLSGNTYCTGIELLLADTLGCEIKIIEGVVIPFRERKTKETAADAEARYIDENFKLDFNIGYGESENLETAVRIVYVNSDSLNNSLSRWCDKFPNLKEDDQIVNKTNGLELVKNIQAPSL